MSKDLGPFIPLYYGDFLSGTMSFGAEEIGAYLLLLCQQWQAGSVENDPVAIERVARCEYGKLRRVLAKFEDHGGVLVNQRCADIRADRERYMDAKRRAGEAGAAARWQDDGTGNGIPNGTSNGTTMRMPCISSSSSSSSSKSTSREEEEGHTPPRISPTGGTLATNPPTLNQCQDHAANIGMTQEDIEAFFNHYDSQGWRKSNGQPATNLRSLLAAWKTRSGEFKAKTKGSSYDHSIS